MVTCQISCGNYGPGYTPVPPEGGRRTYTCIGGVEEQFGVTPQGAQQQGNQQGGQQQGFAEGQSQGGAAPTGGTTGGAETANPTGGTTGGTTTPPPVANTQAAPPAGTLRFILPDCTTDGNCSLTDIMNTGIRVANLLLALSGVAFLVTVLWAGAQLLIFAYEAKSVVHAQKLLTSAVTGLIIIMVAGVIVRLVSDTLGVDGALLRAPGGTSANAPGAQPFRNLGPGSGNGSLPSSNNAFPTGGN